MVTEGLREFFKNLTPEALDLGCLAGLDHANTSSVGYAWVVGVFSSEGQIMPRSGAVPLGELGRQEGRTHLTIACEPCGRQGRYLVRRLLEQQGDLGLPDLQALMNQDNGKTEHINV